MNEADDLQSFIADCEWKTRKILRASNKRMKDNARSLAAKERIKRNGSMGPLAIPTKATPPLGKSKSPNASARGRRSNGMPASERAITTPIKEWKGRAKIIHDAYETIKLFPGDKKSANATIRKENTLIDIHSSLSSSPFYSSKGNPDGPVNSKEISLDNDANGSLRSAEPAMVTRRTIERDFYILSKKRNNPPSKGCQRSVKRSERTPELKTSVLRKKYRSDERLMAAKRKYAERLFEKFKRLKIPYDDSNGIMGEGEAADSDSLASSDEEDIPHAIHDLVESHVADENLRSLKKSNKMLMSSTFEPDVREFWAYLQQNNGGKTESSESGEILSKGCQIPSVPLHIARKKLDSSPGDMSGTEGDSQYICSLETGPFSRYISPFKKPDHVKLRLLLNEPLIVPLAQETTQITLSISIVCNSTIGKDSDDPNVWVYEVYNPCNGSTRVFSLLDDEFGSMNKALQVSMTDEPESQLVEKIVHRQTSLPSDPECTVLVSVSAGETGITSKIYRSKSRIRDVLDLDRLCVEENLIANLHAYEVLQILKKLHIYSAFDTEFWLSDFNGMAVWKPLIEMLQVNTASSIDVVSPSSFTTKAHDSFIALRNELKREANGGIETIVEMIRKQSSVVNEPSMAFEQNPPLSMKVLGCSPYSSTICPGHALLGKRGVWRLSDPVTHDNTDSMFPIWPSLTDIKCPESTDKSQASAFFHYKTLGPQKGDCINVLSSMAFESPVLAPHCFAVDTGYISPPFSEHESLTGIIPYVHLPCKSLLENPLKSRLDVLNPPPVIVLDPGASEQDWENAPRSAEGKVYHCRELNEFDKDGFRVKTFAHKLEYDATISSTVYGISEKAASPNNPSTSPFFTHKSHEACTRCLSRPRTAADYHYILESDGEGTLSEPYLFTTHMSAYRSIFVSRKSISSYSEQEHFIHSMKEAERKKFDLALKMKAAEELVEQRLKERIAKAQGSSKAQEDVESVCENSVAIELSPSSGCPTPPLQYKKVACDVEVPYPPIGILDVDEGCELEQIANLLLNNTYFLKAVAQKLGISEEEVMRIETSVGHHDGKQSYAQISNQTKKGATSTCNEDEHIGPFEESHAELNPHHTSAVPLITTALGNSMPKLKLNCKRYHDDNQVRSRGDGWRRLPKSETIIGDLNLAKRHVQSGTRGPKFKKLEEGRSFIAVNAVQELGYTPDPQQFALEPKSLFIPDLTTERLRLAKTYRQQKKAKESMLSMSQQQALDEILQIPVFKTHGKATDENGASMGVHVEDCDEVTLGRDPIDHVARAVLAVKNHNLPELEQVLDTEGLSIDTRDQHGNTLFILACQQGSKKLAKFLLRRGADMNAQNNGGNAALHYLYEYKHVSLAEYLIRKGADDSITNADGVTVYEGTQLL